MSNANSGERDELMGALASADPVDVGAVPGPDRALFEEIIMEPSVTEPTKSNRHRTIVAAAVLVAAAGIGGGAVALSGNDTKAADPPATDVPEPKVAGIEPAPRTGQRAGEVMSSCMMWDAAVVLPDAEYAFDGTVSAIDDGWVTFEVSEWFSGPGGDLVVLNAEALIPRAEGEVALSTDEQLITEAGQRFLVSGSDGYAGVCNMTQSFTAAEADVWRGVLA